MPRHPLTSGQIPGDELAGIRCRVGSAGGKRRGVDAAIFVDVPCRASGVGYAARDVISGWLDAAQCQGSSVCSS